MRFAALISSPVTAGHNRSRILFSLPFLSNLGHLQNLRSQSQSQTAILVQQQVQSSDNHESYSCRDTGTGKGMPRRAQHCTNIDLTTSFLIWPHGTGGLRLCPKLQLVVGFREAKCLQLQGYWGWKTCISRSQKTPATSAAPQGPVLRTALFNLYQLSG